MSASIYYFTAKPLQHPPAPHEDRDTDDFIKGVEVTIDGVKQMPVFENEVPHVRDERVIKPTGMPPDHWRIV